jgi:TniQ
MIISTSHMLQELQPLPRRTQPFPWEDLSSLLVRIAHQMGYEDPRWIVQPETHSPAIHKPTEIPMLSQQAHYTYLAQLLQLEEKTLHRLTLHRFAPYLQPPEERIHTMITGVQQPVLNVKVFRKYFFPISSTQVCPCCLKEGEPYDRLYWRCRLVLICPYHSTLLLQACPRCHQPISTMRAKLTHCPRCNQINYQTCATPSFKQAEIFSSGSAYLLKQLGVNGAQPDALREEEGTTPLSGLLPYHYFRLFESWRYMLDQTLTQELFLTITAEIHELLPDLLAWTTAREAKDILLHIALFHKVFTNWPTNFFAFLDRFHHLLKKTYGHGYFAKATHYLFFHALDEHTFVHIVQTFRAYDKALWQGESR